MAETQSAPSLREWEADLETLNAAATPGTWLFEHMHGVSFAGLYSNDATGSIIAKFGGFEFAPRPDAETDANCALAAALVNAYREGRMARAADAEHYMRIATERAEVIRRHETTLSEAVAAARAETERYKTALKLAMGLVQRCVGEGITFEEDDPLPEMESWKVAEAIAETLGIDMNSAAYVDLFKGPLTPGGRTDG